MTDAVRVELSLRGRVLAWLAALAAAAAWYSGDADARLAAALLAAPLLVDFVAKPRHLARLRLRVGPRRTVAGAPFTETVLLETNGVLALREVLLHEPRTMRSQQAVLLPDLASGATTRIAIRQRSLHRGVQAERVFLLATHWPLGMFLVRTSVRVPVELVTEPTRVPLRADTQRAETDITPLDRCELPGAEFHSLREHRPDDDARGVHARRSAALGVLVQRVAHGRTPRTVGLVVDLRRPAGRSLDGGTRAFEWGMSAAATLLHRLRGQGAVVRLRMLADPPLELEVLRPHQEHEAMARLAAAAPIAFRSLAPGELASLATLAQCHWIAAGSHDDATERNWPGAEPIVLRGEP